MCFRLNQTLLFPSFKATSGNLYPTSAAVTATLVSPPREGHAFVQHWRPPSLNHEPVDDEDGSRSALGF